MAWVLRHRSGCMLGTDGGGAGAEAGRAVGKLLALLCSLAQKVGVGCVQSTFAHKLSAPLPLLDTFSPPRLPSHLPESKEGTLPPRGQLLSFQPSPSGETLGFCQLHGSCSSSSLQGPLSNLLEKDGKDAVVSLSICEEGFQCQGRPPLFPSS